MSMILVAKVEDVGSKFCRIFQQRNRMACR